MTAKAASRAWTFLQRAPETGTATTSKPSISLNKYGGAHAPLRRAPLSEASAYPDKFRKLRKERLDRLDLVHALAAAASRGHEPALDAASHVLLRQVRTSVGVWRRRLHGADHRWVRGRSELSGAHDSHSRAPMVKRHARAWPLVVRRIEESSFDEQHFRLRADCRSAFAS